MFGSKNPQPEGPAPTWISVACVLGEPKAKTLQPGSVQYAKVAGGWLVRTTGANVMCPTWSGLTFILDTGHESPPLPA